MSWTQDQYNEAISTVLAKAETDTEFRALAVRDIYAAIKAATGHEVPQQFKINIVDATGYHSTIVLPEVRNAADELTESELDAVAGGSKPDGNFVGRDTVGPVISKPVNGGIISQINIQDLN